MRKSFAWSFSLTPTLILAGQGCEVYIFYHRKMQIFQSYWIEKNKFSRSSFIFKGTHIIYKKSQVGRIIILRRFNTIIELIKEQVRDNREDRKRTDSLESWVKALSAQFMQLVSLIESLLGTRNVSNSLSADNNWINVSTKLLKFKNSRTVEYFFICRWVW